MAPGTPGGCAAGWLQRPPVETNRQTGEWTNRWGDRVTQAPGIRRRAGLHAFREHRSDSSRGLGIGGNYSQQLGSCEFGEEAGVSQGEADLYWPPDAASSDLSGLVGPIRRAHNSVSYWYPLRTSEKVDAGTAVVELRGT